jgi:hypothetical protein
MNERAIEFLAAISFFVIGLSHVLHPHAWVDYFLRRRDEGHSGMFAEGFLALSFGTLIVAFHNVWSGLPSVLTIIGWSQVAKGLTRFVAPEFSLRVYRRVAHERAFEFRIGGVFALALATFLAYLAFR